MQTRENCVSLLGLRRPLRPYAAPAYRCTCGFPEVISERLDRGFNGPDFRVETGGLLKAARRPVARRLLAAARSASDVQRACGLSFHRLGSRRRESLPILRPLANGCNGRQWAWLFPCLYGVHVLVVPCLLATLKMTVAILIERQIELPLLGSHLGLVADHLLLHVFCPLLHLLDLGGTGAAGASSFRRTTHRYHDDDGMGDGQKSIHFSTHEQDNAGPSPPNDIVSSTEAVLQFG